MKRIAVLFALVVYFFNIQLLQAQKTKLSIKLSNTISTNITPDYMTIYNGTDLGLGIQRNTSKGNFGGLLIYRFGGSLVSNGLKPYIMNNHLLGGELNYHVLNESKKISPMLGLTLLTEVASNYGGKYIRNYGPHNHPRPNWNNYNNSISYYDSDYYASTPFVGNIVLGCDFQLIKGLNFNMALGYGVRIMKIRYKKWDADQSEPAGDLSDKYSLKEGKLLHCIDLQIGFNYAFPFKKKG